MTYDNFCCIFWMHCHIPDKGKAHMCFTDWCMNVWCIYKVCMSPALKFSLVKGRQFLFGNILKIHSGIIFTLHCHIWNLLVSLAVILHIGKLHLHLGILAFCCLHKGQEFLITQCTIPIDIGHLEQLFSSFEHEVLFNGGAVTKGKNSLGPTYTEEVVC